MTKETINIIISIIAVLFFIGSIQFKEKKTIMLMQSFAFLFYTISYLILNAYSAAIMSIISVIKNYLSFNYESKNKQMPTPLLLVFIMGLIITGYFTYSGPISLIPLFINAAYFIFGNFKNPKYLRQIILVCSLIWIYYNYRVGAYIIIIGNFLELLSSSISLWRFKNDHKHVRRSHSKK